jgi:hypothetical protein
MMRALDQAFQTLQNRIDDSSVSQQPWIFFRSPENIELRQLNSPIGGFQNSGWTVLRLQLNIFSPLELAASSGR